VDLGEHDNALFHDWEAYQRMLRKLEKFFQHQGLRDSSELASLTMFRAFCKIHSGAEVVDGNLARFLFGIARNVALEAHTRSRRRASAAIDDIDPPCEANNPDLEILVGQAVARMSKEDRSLLWMALRGMSTAEIAKELGISEGNVRVRLCHLRKRLRVAAGIEKLDKKPNKRARSAIPE
jgi:RNA polymerase sigma factor (sigma-70 family)